MNKTTFKQKGIDLYYLNKHGVWINTDENTISSLYMDWVTSENITRHYDKEGFLVFGYKYSLIEK